MLIGLWTYFAYAKVLTFYSPGKYMEISQGTTKRLRVDCLKKLDFAVRLSLHSICYGGQF
ncbi:hypothetical protein GCM10022217_12390 [Chryseobacterium ginsenosidimutans]